MGGAADNIDALVEEIKSLPPNKRAEVVAFVRSIRGGEPEMDDAWHDVTWADTTARLDELEGDDPEGRDAWLAVMEDAAKPAHYEPGEGIVVDD